MANTFVSLRRLQRFYNGLKNKFALKSDIKTPDWNAQAITDETSGETTYEDGYIENKPAIWQGKSEYGVVEGERSNTYAEYRFNVEIEPNSNIISYTTQDDISGFTAPSLCFLVLDLTREDGTSTAKTATKMKSIDKNNNIIVAEHLNFSNKMIGTAIGYKNCHDTFLSGHAEGKLTFTYGSNSHAEGHLAQAFGIVSHAEGYMNTAYGDYSHVEGWGTISHAKCSHIQGKYNLEDTEGLYAHIVGNGRTPSNRSNAHTLDWSGNSWYAGTVSAGTIASPAPVTNNNDLTTKAYVDSAVTSSLSLNGNVITLTSSNGTTSSITLPIYDGGVTT